MVSAILGPRRVGKTTLVKNFINENPQNLWVTLNMDVLSEQQEIEKIGLAQKIERMTTQKIGANKKIWVAIDEAQKYPALFNQIKTLYDQFKDKNAIKFILTGSGVLNLHQLSAESLAGRIELYHLYPFTTRETCSLLYPQNNPPDSLSLPILDLIFANPPTLDLQTQLDMLSPFQTLLENSLHTQLIWGGLPEVLQETNLEVRIKYLGNYLQTYLEKDVRALSTITDLALYHKLMQIIAQQTGSVRQNKKITDVLACKSETLKKYRGFLEATLLYQELYPFINSSLKRLTKSPKGYLSDNGLISYLTDIYDMNILTQTGLIGARLENWLLNEIQVTLKRSPRISNLYFWQTSAGREIDFIIQKGNLIFPFEVTYGAKPTIEKIRNLQAFMLAEKVARGFYVYNGEYRYDAKTNIYFIPAWAVG